MKIKTLDSDHIINIDDKYIGYSPYLSTLASTEVGVDMDGDSYLIDVDIALMDEYIQFLQGNQFIMNEYISELFDMMGHSNTMDYPMEFWKIKLRDNWIRDNMYKHELFNDNPYYGLTKMNIVNKIDNLPNSLGNGLYVAGGACLYMIGGTSKYDDIDLFFTMNKVDASNYMDKIQKHSLNSSNTSISIGSNSITKLVRYPEGKEKYQYILRLYSSPTEIVHGFDLDCVGILFDGKNLWATDRAVYSLDNATNHYDPLRSSSSYEYRLAKYRIRGFKVELPHFDESRIDTLKVKSMFKDIVYEYLDYTGEDDTEEYRYTPYDMDYIDTMLNLIDIDPKSISHSNYASLCTILNKMNIDKDRYYHLIGILYKQINYRSKVLIYKDRASILILSKIYGFFTFKWRTYDYQSDSTRIEKIDDHDQLTYNAFNLPWMTQNPMTQLTSTFNPDPIEDLDEWYTSSPLYYTTSLIEV